MIDYSNLRVISLYCILTFTVISCQKKTPSLTIPSPKQTSYTSADLALSKDEYYDKVLGALVGSAIGDAMGVGTEMWNREDIQLKYGYIQGLSPVFSGQSPEGPWGHNLPPGATTDDTRWKMLTTHYLVEYKKDLSDSNFAEFISSYYQNQVESLSDESSLLNPDSLDEKLEKVDWIKEWARVALDYTENESAKNHRFYGGEMSCAGLLYSPMFGLIASTAEDSYDLAYEHAIFDIGYAKDITGLAAAMCHMAMRTSNMDSIVQVHAYVDPYDYLNSRLVGRIPHTIAKQVHEKVLKVQEIDEALYSQESTSTDTAGRTLPAAYPGSELDWYRQELLYGELEKNQRMIAFHAGEIWEILCMGMIYGDGEFLKSLQFIINYGRDNDTVGAIAGMILGAKDGFDQLPEEIKHETLRVNRDILGIDLEKLASSLVDSHHH